MLLQGLCYATITLQTGARGEYHTFGFRATSCTPVGGRSCFILRPVINVCLDCSKAPSQMQNNQSSQPITEGIKAAVKQTPLRNRDYVSAIRQEMDASSRAPQLLMFL